MKKVILTYGLIGGFIVSVIMLGSFPLHESGVLNFDNGMIVGYASMVIALSMVFFGIKSYRDNYSDGKITFGKGFQVGMMITMIACLMYAISWEWYYSQHGNEFTQKYTEHYIAKMKENGASEQEVKQMEEEMNQFAESYKNPLIRFGMTIMEILPVGLLITLASAGLFRKPNFLPQKINA